MTTPDAQEMQRSVNALSQIAARRAVQIVALQEQNEDLNSQLQAAQRHAQALQTELDELKKPKPAARTRGKK